MTGTATFRVHSALGTDAIKNARDARAADLGVDLDSKRLAAEIVDDVQGSDSAPVLKCVVHEVERPPLIRAQFRRDDVTAAECDTTLYTFADMQFRGGVNAINALMIDTNAVSQG